MSKGGCVGATQGKEQAKRIKNAGQGKENDPDGRLTRDAKGKVGKKAAKDEADFEKKCALAALDSGLPAGTAAAIGEAAVEEAVLLATEFFNAPLRDRNMSADEDKDSAVGIPPRPFGRSSG